MKTKQFQINHLNINHSKVVAKSFYDKTFTRGDVEKMVKDLAKKYQSINPNMKFMVSVDTPIGFRSGKSFSINENVRLPNISDSDFPEWSETQQFVVYAWNGKTNSYSVGEDENNDCLFNAIKDTIKYYRLPKDFKAPDKLKKYLKIKRNDKIPLSKISMIEDLFKININLSGDECRVSKHKYTMTCNFIVKNEHIAIEKQNEQQTHELINGILKFHKELAFYYYDADKVIIYDGHKFFEESYNEFQCNKLTLPSHKKYAYIHYEKKLENIEDEYNTLLSNTNKLNELTKGKIDLSRSGYLPSNEALKFLHYSTLSFPEPELLNSSEHLWINKSFQGALIFCQSNQYEMLYEYDKNSAYPSALTDVKFSFPYKSGEFKTIEILPEILNYGIYRVIISPSDDNHINKLFRFNSENYYTHYDIALAKDLNLKIELVQDDEANVLLYPNRLNAHQYFGEFVNEMYSLKYQNPLAKEILNSLWGRLCQKVIRKSILKPQNEININETEYDILNLENLPNENYKISYVKKDKVFKYNHARLGTFLTAYVRKQMAKEMFLNRENIVKCHTDSIVSTIPMKELILSNDIGDWKFKQGKAIIQASNKKIEYI
jgi:hypothetical protein